MSRFRLPCAALCVALCLPFVAVAQQAGQEAGQALSRAMDAMRAGDWGEARAAARDDGRIAEDLIVWHALRDGRGDPAEVRDFLSRNPDWPGLPLLRERVEPIVAKASGAEIRAFFDGVDPATGTGALALADALRTAGDSGAAELQVVLAWRTLALSSEERAAFLDEWGPLLAPHHADRLDMALWRGWTVNAGAMLPLMDEGWRRLAEARLGLRNDAAGVDGLIEAVPDRLADHPGLAHERFLWRMRKARYADAAALILERSTSAEALGEPWAWAARRHALARDLMRDGAVVDAYRVAASHYLSEGSDFAALEWLSGYLALRFLARPDLALRHFEAFAAAVETPISLGRAGYWLGRTHEALDNTDAARAAFALGGRFQTTFYGLLAAERAGLGPDPALAGPRPAADWREAAFLDSDVTRAALLLLAAGEDRLGERFLTHLAESLDRDGIAQMGAMLEQMERPHIEVMLGKRAAQAGLEVHAPYFALHPALVKSEFPVPRELVLAIARRESEFDPGVVSGAGARGFMQVMPGTARDMAAALSFDYDLDRLLSDPVYNTTLGAGYLAELAARFDGNIVMVAAGYNAGPSRPDSWMARFGDPRQGSVDVVDWIEFIPFDETRNYVMRVAESLPVYRARLGEAPHPVAFSQELIGRTITVTETPGTR